MSKTYRYLLYFLIGVGIYYVIGADKNPDVLNQFHRYAPVLIIGIFVLLLVMQQIRKKRDKDKEDKD